MTPLASALIVGGRGVGKTLFWLQLASRFGLRSLAVRGLSPGGETTTYSVAEARRAFAGPRPPQGVVLPGRRRLLFIDGSGLTDAVDPDPWVRQGQGETLRHLLEATLVLHLVDASNSLGGLPELDTELAQFGQQRGGYLLLANKCDLPAAGPGLRVVRRRLSAAALPISARTGEGLREVQARLRRHL